MNVGQRVRVNIRRPEEYAFGAPPCLNGKAGTIVVPWRSLASPIPTAFWTRIREVLTS